MYEAKQGKILTNRTFSKINRKNLNHFNGGKNTSMAIQRFIYIKQSEYEKMSPSYTQIANWLEMANYNCHKIKNVRGLIHLWREDSTEREYYWYGGQKEFVEQLEKEIIKIHGSKYTYRNLNSTNLKVDKIVDFQAENGLHESGYYYNLTDGFPLQKNDAEVALIQRIENWLSNYNRECDDKELRLLIKISKGPCNHCRNIINKFKHKHPQIEIIVEYSQKNALEKESEGKSEQQQSELSYGYSNARNDEKRHNIFYRRLTDLALPNCIGHNNRNLDNLYNKNKGGFNILPDIDKFVETMPEKVWGEDKEPIAIYFKHKFIYERELALDNMENYMLSNFQIPHAEPGKVVAAAKLLLLSYL